MNYTPFQILECAVREHQICTAFQLLRAVNIEPILLKGWSVGRHYADKGQRRLGDIDLLIESQELTNAKQATEARNLNIDWHTQSDIRVEFPEAGEPMNRSELAALEATEIRVLCEEHNLRLVAIHMLRHGCWLSKWFTDLAVLLANRKSNFDWRLCLSKNALLEEWVLSAMVLAQEFGKADLRDTPAVGYQIPKWLRQATSSALQQPDAAAHQPPESIWTGISHPWRLPVDLRRRWPNPITAAVMTRSSFNARPVVNQLLYCANLTSAFARRYRRGS